MKNVHLGYRALFGIAMGWGGSYVYLVGFFVYSFLTGQITERTTNPIGMILLLPLTLTLWVIPLTIPMGALSGILLEEVASTGRQGFAAGVALPSGFAVGVAMTLLMSWMFNGFHPVTGTNTFTLGCFIGLPMWTFSSLWVWGYTYFRARKYV